MISFPAYQPILSTHLTQSSSPFQDVSPSSIPSLSSPIIFQRRTMPDPAPALYSSDVWSCTSHIRSVNPTDPATTESTELRAWDSPTPTEPALSPLMRDEPLLGNHVPRSRPRPSLISSLSSETTTRVATNVNVSPGTSMIQTPANSPDANDSHDLSFSGLLVHSNRPSSMHTHHFSPPITFTRYEC